MLCWVTASEEQLNFNEAHKPNDNGVEAFNVILPTIKGEILKSRTHWDLHEPKMWSRAQGISDKALVTFTIEEDLVAVRLLVYLTDVKENEVFISIPQLLGSQRGDFIRYYPFGKDQIACCERRGGRRLRPRQVSTPLAIHTQSQRFPCTTLSTHYCCFIRIHDPPNRVSAPAFGLYKETSSC